MPSGSAVAGCGRCGEKLRSAAAWKVRRCSGGCLDGDDRRCWEFLVAWRRDVALRLELPEDQVASSAALFGSAVARSCESVAGFKVVGDLPDLSAFARRLS